jgi:biotin-(acetyl-CoA carboxylase) ligase
VDRNRLAAVLIARLTEHLDEFNEFGFANLSKQWARRDVLHGQTVRAVGQDRRIIQGRAAGVDESGQLLVKGQSQLHRLHSGEVTLQK